jgi:ABC-2 type transport system ATP-binding protein
MPSSTHNDKNKAISTRGLVREFADVRAVNGVDLDVYQGEVYGFLGPNGAGKTTVIRMLITLLAPTSGEITVAGHDAVQEPHEVRLRIGAALQDAALDNKQTGLELLRLQGKLYGLSGKQIDQRIGELSDLVDIGDAMNRLIGTYSGGMKRRLDLAAALIHNPEVLFLDEPTSGLDPISRARIWQEVRDINSELGVTIFLTTQYLEEADALAHRVGIIDRGVLAAQGTPADLKRARGSDLIVAKLDGEVEAAVEAVKSIESVAHVEAHGQELTVSVANGAALISTVALALNQRGIGVQELTLRTPTLDDVFLHVTGARLQEGASASMDVSGEVSDERPTPPVSC